MSVDFGAKRTVGLSFVCRLLYSTNLFSSYAVKTIIVLYQYAGFQHKDMVPRFKYHDLLSGDFRLDMKVFAVLLSVASVVVANIPYTEPGVRPGQGGVAVVRPIVPVVQQPVLLGGIATGAAGGDLSQGQFTGVHGTSQVQKLSSSAEVSNVQQNENFKRIAYPRDTFPFMMT